MACLDDDAIADIAVSESLPLSADVRAHLAGCPACREKFAGAVSALRDPVIVAEIEHLDSRDGAAPRRRTARYAAIAALAGGILLLPPLLRERRPDPGRQLRDDAASITMTVAPTIVSPRGAVRPASPLIWTSIPGADRYEITVFSQDGLVVWTGESQDTAMALPLRLKASVTYLWKVRARTGFDRWTESSLVQFSVASCKGVSC